MSTPVYNEKSVVGEFNKKTISTPDLGKYTTTGYKIMEQNVSQTQVFVYHLPYPLQTGHVNKCVPTLLNRCIVAYIQAHGNYHRCENM